MIRSFRIEEFNDINDELPDIDVPVYVLNKNFEVGPVDAYYMDGAFWPFDYDIMFPLFVTHWRLIPQANKPTDFEMFLSSPRIMKRYEPE